MITLAKAICGGYPGGAIGMGEELGGARRRRHRSPVRHLQRQPAGDGGRRGGADRGAHRRRVREAGGDQRRLLKAGCDGIIERLRPARLHARASAPRAASSSPPSALREYRDYLTKVDGELSTLAWLYHMNHGIFMTPGVEEEWTLSIAHTDERPGALPRAFEAFARDVTA